MLMWLVGLCGPPGSVHGISQAGILERIANFFSRASSQLRDQTHVCCIGRLIVFHWATKDIILQYKIKCWTTRATTTTKKPCIMYICEQNIWLLHHLTPISVSLPLRQWVCWQEALKKKKVYLTETGHSSNCGSLLQAREANCPFGKEAFLILRTFYPCVWFIYFEHLKSFILIFSTTTLIN